MKPCDRLAGDVVDRYVANVKIVQTLARGYGFRPLFFWQPTVFNKAELTAVEREEAQKYAWTEPAFRAVYEKIRTSPGLKAVPAFQDLSAIFAEDQKAGFHRLLPHDRSSQRADRRADGRRHCCIAGQLAQWRPGSRSRKKGPRSPERLAPVPSSGVSSIH